jgi:hypothetical protein
LRPEEVPLLCSQAGLFMARTMAALELFKFVSAASCMAMRCRVSASVSTPDTASEHVNSMEHTCA